VRRLIFVTALLLSCDDTRHGNPDLSMNNDMACMGQACLRMDCGAGKPRTSVSGRVMAPNGIDPVYQANVYVPYSIPAMTTGVRCELCNDPLGGQPITSTVTAVDGSFTLPDIPVTANVPIVIQKGRFRRVAHVTPTACQDNPLTVDQARLPKNQTEGDLPRMAVGTGNWDQIECVLRSIGIDDAEFTDPSGMGSVHLYRNGSDGTAAGSDTQFAGLLGDLTRLDGYNLVFVNCTSNLWMGLANKTVAALNLYDYVNGGGRLYVTDWAYDYMEQVTQFAPYIFFEGGGDMTSPQPLHAAAIASDVQDFPATVTDPQLAQWLHLVSASGIDNMNRVTITDLLADWALAHSTAGDTGMYASQTWVHGTTNGGDRPLTVTFDYNACGKVLYSSYHTRSPGGANGTTATMPFPMYCKSTAQSMLPQEKILEYLLLELSSCIGPLM
jgi:hypothetical protein